MKKTFINILIASLVFGAISCNKDANFKATRSFADASTSYLKINYLSSYPTNPSVQLSINGERVSGLIKGRTPFPGGGFNTSGASFPDYLALKSGSNVLSIAIPKINTNVDSILLFSTSLTLDAAKYYTAHVSDTGSKTKSFLIEDILDFSDTTCRYRFVNMMPNVPLIDLYYGTTLVSTGIPFLGTSAYFDRAVPATSLAWTIRETGTLPTSTALATYSSTNTILRGRMYTAFALGYKGQTASTTRPYISFLLNK